ncbi:hypothetical protein IZ6_18290 [Terrihabitans soli]|uniref:Porin n=1 Tax=Terrihabitans soli TaxID=708113 RepID=A0A6S6QL35_9HYPH|nr:hypothetical protein [Terrihabitans soli]BCJ91094.1 hypothetical protein IZ6_18290 [Terrihabitans soli]
MPFKLRSALALSTFLAVPGNGTAFVQALNGTGDISPAYNFEIGFERARGETVHVGRAGMQSTY